MKKKKHEYTISTGTETRRIRGRQNAVDTANEMSMKTWKPVRIRREDERMEMRFRRGVLQEYKYRARRRRRR